MNSLCRLLSEASDLAAQCNVGLTFLTFNGSNHLSKFPFMIVLVVYPTKLETFLSTPHGENFHVHYSMSHSYCMSSSTGAIYTNLSDSESPNEALLTYGHGAPFAICIMMALLTSRMTTSGMIRAEKLFLECPLFGS